MARPIQVTIVESREELERCLDKQTSATGKERLQMLYWLKLGIVDTKQNLVKSCYTRVRQQLPGGWQGTTVAA